MYRARHARLWPFTRLLRNSMRRSTSSSQLPTFDNPPGTPTNRTSMSDSAVGVEKVVLGKLAENSSRQEALQAILSDRVDIFYHRI